VRETICDAFKAHQLSEDSVPSETSLLHLLQILKKVFFPFFLSKEKVFFFEKRILLQNRLKVDLLRTQSVRMGDSHLKSGAHSYKTFFFKSLILQNKAIKLEGLFLAILSKSRSSYSHHFIFLLTYE
jgi:hypothetical protein